MGKLVAASGGDTIPQMDAKFPSYQDLYKPLV